MRTLPALWRKSKQPATKVSSAQLRWAFAIEAVIKQDRQAYRHEIKAELQQMFPNEMIALSSVKMVMDKMGYTSKVLERRAMQVDIADVYRLKFIRKFAPCPTPTSLFALTRRTSESHQMRS